MKNSRTISGSLPQKGSVPVEAACRPGFRAGGLSERSAPGPTGDPAYPRMLYILYEHSPE